MLNVSHLAPTRFGISIKEWSKNVLKLLYIPLQGYVSPSPDYYL